MGGKWDFAKCLVRRRSLWLDFVKGNVESDECDGCKLRLSSGSGIVRFNKYIQRTDRHTS